MTLNEYITHERQGKIDLAFKLVEWIVMTDLKNPKLAYATAFDYKAQHLINGEAWNITLLVEKVKE